MGGSRDATERWLSEMNDVALFSCPESSLYSIVLETDDFSWS